MNATDIINQVEKERRNHVIVQWNKNSTPGNKTLVINSECWAVTVTDKPEEHFKALDEKFQGRATHHSKFPINSFSEGVVLFKELCAHFGDEVSKEPIEEPSEPEKQLYLAIHILYEVS